MYGLKNKTKDNWTTTADNGNVIIIEPEKTIRLKNGLKINFVGIEGEIRYNW